MNLDFAIISNDASLPHLLSMYLDVVVELPQTHEDDLRCPRVARGRRRFSHSWCMCVVSHGYGGDSFVGDGCHACETKPRGMVANLVITEYFPCAM